MLYYFHDTINKYQIKSWIHSVILLHIDAACVMRTTPILCIANVYVQKYICGLCLNTQPFWSHAHAHTHRHIEMKRKFIENIMEYYGYAKFIVRTTATMAAAVTGDDRGITALLHSQTVANKLRSSKSEGKILRISNSVWETTERR